jgi:transglutaminase-like putative cysteine protease
VAIVDADSSVPGPVDRRIGCQLRFEVIEPSDFVFQLAVSRTAGKISDEELDVRTDDQAVSALTPLDNGHGATLHVVHADPGTLTVTYRATVHGVAAGASLSDLEGGVDAGWPSPEYERQVYLRPSRYCPSDHLIGFAVAEFGVGADVTARIDAITNWIRSRVGYVPGSGSVHDSAEHTLLTGMGTCRDFAHLGVALCRATGIPARFTAVYAPGLTPMDFHAVFEAFDDGHWWVHDPTGLAPRQSLVRVVTGRDAADTAFAAVNAGVAELDAVDVIAVADPALPIDELSSRVELA